MEDLLMGLAFGGVIWGIATVLEKFQEMKQAKKADDDIYEED
jgi:hypothetical protein